MSTVKKPSYSKRQITFPLIPILKFENSQLYLSNSFQKKMLLYLFCEKIFIPCNWIFNEQKVEEIIISLYAFTAEMRFGKRGTRILMADGSLVEELNTLRENDHLYIF